MNLIIDARLNDSHNRFEKQAKWKTNRGNVIRSKVQRKRLNIDYRHPERALAGIPIRVVFSSR